MNNSLAVSQDGDRYDPETGVVILADATLAKLPDPETKQAPATRRTAIEQVMVATEASLRRRAKVALKSGYLPSSIYNEEQVLMIVRAGEELGLPFMASLRSINLVEGKITLDASLMRALAFRKIPGARIDFIECTSEKCVVEMQRPGGKVNTFRFTIEDAQRANLTRKNNWQKYPISMLIARASAIGCRAVFPDALLGGSVYDPDEIDDGPRVVSEYEAEIEKLKQEILALSVSLPEEKRTACIDQTNDAVLRCNVPMLEKILTRIREIVEWREVEKESKGIEVGTSEVVSQEATQ